MTVDLAAPQHLDVDDLDVEHLDVVVVGAGLSGICAAHYVQTDAPWASYAVLEARESLGGTWDLFRYPGIRSDSDMFTLGYSFRPWPGGESIAEGGRILQYLRDTAAEEGIDRNIRFRHKLLSADWHADDARWHLVVERAVGDGGADPAATETVAMTCSFLMSCSGYYRYDRGYLPDFEGMDDFEGIIVHPQEWPADLDVTGRRIVVIGSGATAITLVPSLARDAEHVTMLQRSPTYVAALPSRNPLTKLIRKVLPRRAAAVVLKWTNVGGTLGFYQLSRRRPQLMKRILRKGLERELPSGFDIDTHFTPRYDPWDQRLCLAADGDLFRVLRDGSASVVTDRIVTFTPKGLLLESGEELQADVIVTATGLELLFLGGVDLRMEGEPVDISNRLTYKGMMLEGVPNLAMAVGYTNASWTLKADLTCQYVGRLLRHLHETGLATCTPRAAGGNVDAEPLLGLTSGYIQRSVDAFPKQGTRFPWRVHQNYLLDYREMRLRGITDDAMEFGPAPRPVATTTKGAA